MCSLNFYTNCCEIFQGYVRSLLPVGAAGFPFLPVVTVVLRFLMLFVRGRRWGMELSPAVQIREIAHQRERERERERLKKARRGNLRHLKRKDTGKGGGRSLVHTSLC